MISEITNHHVDESFKLFRHLEEILSTSDVKEIIFKFNCYGVIKTFIVEDLVTVSINSVNPNYLEFKNDNCIQLLNFNHLEEVEVII